MSDSPAVIDPGTTPTLPVACDKIGDDYYQKFKLFDPTPGSTSGFGISSNPFFVAQSGSWSISGVVHIDDNSGSITVDGSVSAVQSGTWNIGTITSITNVVHIDDNSGSLTVDGTVGVSGVVHVDDNSSSLTIDDGGSSITVDGTLSVSDVRGTTPTRSDVSGTASSTTLKAANASRISIRIYNDSTALLYLLEGTGTASSSNFTTILYPTDLYIANDYTGQINGVWASATGNARVTEIA